MSCSWAAAVDHRRHVLAAGLEVLDRAPQPSRQLRGEQVLGVERRLRAEAAADVRRDDAHFLLREPEHLRELVALVVRGLRGGVEGEAAGLPVGDAHRGLHGHRGAALVAQVDREPVRRGGELGLGVVGGELLLQHEVGREAVEDGCGGLGGRRREGGHDGQLLVVDDHGRGGVGRQRRDRWRRPRRWARRRSAPSPWPSTVARCRAATGSAAGPVGRRGSTRRARRAALPLRTCRSRRCARGRGGCVHTPCAACPAAGCRRRTVRAP